MAIALLCGALGRGAEQEIIKSRWSEFQREVTSRKLEGRSARIRLVSGRAARARVRRITDTGIAVDASRATKQWKSAGGETLIPRAEVASVQFGRKSGNRRWIGMLAGLGAGAGVGAAIATGSDVTEGVGVIIIPLGAAAIALAGLASGYYIGKSLDRAAPEFVIVP